MERKCPICNHKGEKEVVGKNRYGITSICECGHLFIGPQGIIRGKE